jgi:hypothetical protein
MNLPRVRLTAGEETLDVYVAANPQDRSLGLMHRRAMAPDEGMLFVEDEAARQNFWMKDTLLPLSIAFLDEDGTITQIEDMAPESLDAHRSEQAVRYILEVHQGWFARKGIRAGMRLAGPVFLVAAGR